MQTDNIPAAPHLQPQSGDQQDGESSSFHRCCIRQVLYESFFFDLYFSEFVCCFHLVSPQVREEHHQGENL